MTVHGNTGYTQGCRCGICRDARAAHVAVRRKAMNAGWKWLRTYRPETHDRLLSEAYEAAGIERRPVGRPVGNGTWSEPTGRRLRLADIDARDGAA